jgi:hypothetical protein
VGSECFAAPANAPATCIILLLRATLSAADASRTLVVRSFVDPACNEQSSVQCVDVRWPAPPCAIAARAALRSGAPNCDEGAPPPLPLPADVCVDGVLVSWAADDAAVPCGNGARPVVSTAQLTR